MTADSTLSSTSTAAWCGAGFPGGEAHPAPRPADKAIPRTLLTIKSQQCNRTRGIVSAALGHRPRYFMDFSRLRRANNWGRSRLQAENRLRAAHNIVSGRVI